MDSKLEIEAPSTETEQALLAWMQANATPLKYIKAGNGFADLQFLKELLKDVKVVGLGEATHGTREFFQMKHRLVEFLVTEMGFTHFMIEGNYSACQPLNEYILHGIGDRATALTAQWHVVWDTQEVAAMVDWMRSYNQAVGDGQKISWQGS